jgi:hypothetical protein
MDNQKYTIDADTNIYIYFFFNFCHPRDMTTFIFNFCINLATAEVIAVAHMNTYAY